MARRRLRRATHRTDDPLWYKDALIYELHVRSFFDSNGDGIGDFPGLTEKLDYLQDLGVTALWILPFYPSPLRDDGYDIADYRSVNPAYGDLDDFREFLEEAHARDLRVITELVINHTSDQHPWFQRARRSPPGSPERDYYVWSDTPEPYRDARIIFKDFEPSNWSWDPVAKQYFWHRFYSHQPDLNFENPAVVRELTDVLDFWMEMGVDGMRLDAIPYLFEREGTNCENLPETHAMLKHFRAHLDGRFEGRMFLAEANQWPEDAAEYFGDGDECHMNFHFPLMPRLFMSVRMEDRFPIIDILDQTPEIPENAQWAIFLRNHDELTLEMVTDEERDYMYRTYAHDRQARINLGIRRRLAPLLQNNRRKIELLNGLLFSLPGTPVLYYGDEIGMGDNFYLGDRNGVRTPMQWSGDRNAGFSRANPQKLFLPVIIDPEYHFESLNVEAQQQNPSSLLWWMKRLIALRQHHQAFGRGGIEFLLPDNRKVLTFVRGHGDERILVVANLSRFVQAVELDLSAYEGMVPVELFGQADFPPIGELPYFLTLGPHSFYWFSLEMAERGDGGPTRVESAEQVAVFAAAGDWDTLLHDRSLHDLEAALGRYLRGRRWFQGKARRVRRITIDEVLPVREGDVDARLLFLRVSYAEGGPELYLLPAVLLHGEAAMRALRERPQHSIARGESGEDPGVTEWLILDALQDPGFGKVLLHGIAEGRRYEGEEGRLEGSPTGHLRDALARGPVAEASVGRAEQSNTSILFGDRLILKVYRRIDEGENLDLELGRALGEAGFPHTPAVAGSLSYRSSDGTAITVGILHEFIANEGDAWALTLDALTEYFERALAQPDGEGPEVSASPAAILRAAAEEPTAAERDLIGAYLDSAWLLGRRTAELHAALASLKDDPEFALEEFSSLYQRALYQSMRNLVGQTLQLLERQGSGVPEELRPSAATVVASRGEILGRLREVVGGKMSGVRIRVHGDYHLGQLLYTGKDFVITDFEGEPARPLSERRLKRSPLRDVAGMLRSFHYAAHSALRKGEEGGALRAADVEHLEPWARYWYVSTSAAFLRGYLRTGGDQALVPADDRELTVLLGAFLMEKAIYELGYELNNRPAWMGIPLKGITELLES